MVKSRHRRQEVASLASRSTRPHHPIRNDIVPKLELVDRVPADLGLPSRNVRKADAAHISEVATAISNLGFCDPVLIDEQDHVLDGVIRVEAAKLLGLPRIPCIRANHLSTSECRLVRMALNRIGEKGSWNFDQLKLELQELIFQGAPIEITGFCLTEVDQIIIGEEPALTETGPLAPEPDAKPVAQIGDIFAMGKHRIICGDSTDRRSLETLMSDDKARLILTDQPYNVSIADHITSGDCRELLMAGGEMSDTELRAFNTAWIGASLRHLCDGGLFGTFIDWRGYPAVHAAALQFGLVPLNLVVWAKTKAAMGSLYRSQHELLPLFKHGNAPHINNVELGKNGRGRSNVWNYPGACSIGDKARKGLRHYPTVKPVAMIEDALLDMTERGDIVLDPFLGSGSTLIAAEGTGRRCRGLELDPLHVDVMLRRYEAVTRRPAILETTGETYTELAAGRRSSAT
jgi:DNA modification methylase